MAVVVVKRRVANPRRKARRRLNPRRRRSVRRNPALVLTLGAVNPKTKKRRINPMRRHRRKLNPHRRRAVLPLILASTTRRKRNYSRRRRNPVVAVRRRRARRRNPILGGIGAPQIFGGLTGVAATRFVSKMIPPSFVSFAGQFGPLLSDLIGAVAVSWITDKIGGANSFKSGISFGAAMQVGSTAITTFVPGLRQYGFGIGALVPGQFPVPQNPIRPLALPAPAENGKARVTTSGLSRAFGTAF